MAIDERWINVLFEVNASIRYLHDRGDMHERVSILLDDLDYVLDHLKAGPPGYRAARDYLLASADREEALARHRDLLTALPER